MLDGAKNTIKNLMSNKKMIIVILLIALFFMAAIYAYKTYAVPRINPDYVSNKEFIKGDGLNETADIYFFYTEWCPHCKKAKPEWQQFKNKIDSNKINGVKINFREVNCDEDQETANKFKVEGYPTIKLVYGNKVVDYDAKPQTDTLLQFVNASL